MRVPKVAVVLALGASLLTGAGTTQVGAAAPREDGPIRIVLTGPKRPQTIFAAWPYTCALDIAGKAWCWGDGSRGRLGDGDTDWHSRARPVAVVGGHTFTSLTAGENYTCALDTAGKAWCWGDGSRGRLGDGDLSDHETGTPVAVVGDHSFTSLDAGETYTCALDTAGKAWCWGDGDTGRLGDGNTSKHFTAKPVAVVGGHRFESLSAGSANACGVAATGKAWCWGDGDSGLLGDGITRGHTTGTPVAVVGGHTFASLTAGAYHMCGIDDAGKAWCWGYGERGRLGDGDTDSHSRARPVAVEGGHTFTSLTASWGHTCGVARNGKAWCWGGGHAGRLGDRDTSKHFTAMPVAVVGGHRFTSLSAGENHTCGVAKNGKAWCWGAGGFGRLGDGITKGHLTGTPVAVVGGHTFAHP